MSEIIFKEVETVDGFKKRDKSFIAKLESYQVVPKGTDRMQVLQLFFNDDETPLELIGLDRPNPEGRYSNGFGIGMFLNSLKMLKQNPVKVLIGQDDDKNYVIKFEPELTGKTLSIECKENKYTKNGEEKLAYNWKVIGIESVGTSSADQTATTGTTSPAPTEEKIFIDEWKEALNVIFSEKPGKLLDIVKGMTILYPGESNKIRKDMNATRSAALNKLISEGFIELKEGIYSLK